MLIDFRCSQGNIQNVKHCFGGIYPFWFWKLQDFTVLMMWRHVASGFWIAKDGVCYVLHLECARWKLKMLIPFQICRIGDSFFTLQRKVNQSCTTVTTLDANIVALPRSYNVLYLPIVLNNRSIVFHLKLYIVMKSSFEKTFNLFIFIHFHFIFSLTCGTNFVDSANIYHLFVPYTTFYMSIRETF